MSGCGGEQVGLGCDDACVQCMSCGFVEKWTLKVPVRYVMCGGREPVIAVELMIDETCLMSLPLCLHG